MIARTTLALALLVPAAIVPLTRPTEAASIVQEAKGNPELLAFMEDLNSTLRGLGRGLREEDGGVTKGLAEVLRLQRASIEAKDQMPVVVTAITDEKKRRASEIEYRTQMQALVSGLFELELAYVAADTKKVESLLKQLDKVKREGHDGFKP